MENIAPVDVSLVVGRSLQKPDINLPDVSNDPRILERYFDKDITACEDGTFVDLSNDLSDGIHTLTFYWNGMNSYDEYCMDTERFYVRNRKTIHSLKQMIFQTSYERKSTQDCESTLEGPNYYLGEQYFGGDTFYYYQFGPVRYHFVFRSADYRIWRAYIDSVRRSGGIGYGMALK